MFIYARCLGNQRAAKRDATKKVDTLETVNLVYAF